jgi:hypothetical protein
MTPEDGFRRNRDPSRRRKGGILGLLLIISLVSLAIGVWLTRNQSRPTAPAASVTARPGSVSFTPSGTSPTAISNQPVLGVGFSVVDDPSTHQLVLFGGIDSYQATWLWDGRHWSHAHPPVSPPGRFEAAAAYDPLTKVIMLQGGRLETGDAVDDTWAWTGRTWRQLDSGTGNPPGGGVSVMAWDDIHSQMVLVTGNGGPGGPGGDTWFWQGNRWVRHVTGQPLTFGPAVVGVAVDPVSKSLLASSCCASDQVTSATWQWDGIGWRPVGTSIRPPAVVGLALDPTSGRLLLCSDPARAIVGRQAWSWDGKNWKPLAARLPVFPEAEVTDVDEGDVVILGSLVQPQQGTPQPVQLWSWTGSAWILRG